MSSWNPALPAYTSKIKNSPGYFQGNSYAIQTVLSSSNLSGSLPYIPSTAPMWFYTNVAPAGWTATGVGADSLLAIRANSGSGSYNIAGGSQAGTWVGPGYSLLNSDIQSFAGFGGNYIKELSPDTTYTTTPPTAHHHDWTTTRPTASVGILCTKNA